jgi:hypothetical protein
MYFKYETHFKIPLSQHNKPDYNLNQKLIKQKLLKVDIHFKKLTPYLKVKKYLLFEEEYENIYQNKLK